MHDPIGFSSFGCSSLVENQGLSHTNKGTFSKDWPVLPSGLPVAWGSCTVCSQSSCIFSITLSVEVPFFASHTSRFYQISSINRLSLTHTIKNFFITKNNYIYLYIFHGLTECFTSKVWLDFMSPPFYLTVYMFFINITKNKNKNLENYISISFQLI